MGLDSSGPPPAPHVISRMWSFTCLHRHCRAGFRWQKQIACRASQKFTKKARQMGKAGTARGQLEEKAARGTAQYIPGEKLQAGPSSSVCLLPWQASVPLRCLEHGLLLLFFFRAGSVGLHFYAFLSEFSQGNSSWWAQKCQSESWPSLGPWRFFRKLKRFLGQCLLWVFLLLLLTFSIFFFFLFFIFTSVASYLNCLPLSYWWSPPGYGCGASSSSA